jgi:hypothetical protein
MSDDKREKIKLRNNSTKPEQEEITPSGQERITEKLSISVPTQPLLRPTGLMTYMGQRVRLLLRDGSVIVGFLQKRLWNYVHLLNIEETGRDFRLTADWCDVDLGTIARVYPATAKVEQIQRS